MLPVQFLKWKDTPKWVRERIGTSADFIPLPMCEGRIDTSGLTKEKSIEIKYAALPAGFGTIVAFLNSFSDEHAVYVWDKNQREEAAQKVEDDKQIRKLRLNYLKSKQ